MCERNEDRELSAWIISAAGEEVARTFTAPVQMPGWEERPWVKLRPLTAREALRRESLGLRDEYQVGPDGQTTLVRRSYDREAMAELDLRCCLVDFLLPVRDEGGQVQAARMGDARNGPKTPQDGIGGLEARPTGGCETGSKLASDGSLLDRLPPALAAWLSERIEAVNMRRPEDAAILGDAKKG